LAIAPDQHAQLIYPVARQFRERCLANGDSLFSPGQPVWAMPTLDDFWRRFVEAADTSKADFWTKLQGQLAGAPALTVQLAAEAVSVYYLIAYETPKHATKLEQLRLILSWSPGPPVVVPKDIEGGLAGGFVGSGGTSYSIHKAFLLWQLLAVARSLRAMSPDACAATLADPWKFREHVHATEIPSGSTMREALLHLVHPEVFENITSFESKKKIAAGFSHLLPPDLAGGNVDLQLFEIRSKLAATTDTFIHFFESPWVEQWSKIQPSTWLLAWDPAALPWSSEQIREAIATLDGGAEVCIPWGVGSAGVHPGDRFYLLRRGDASERQGIFASGSVVEPAESDPQVMAKVTADSKAAGYASIRLDELLDTHTTEVLALQDLAAQFPKVGWHQATSCIELPTGVRRDLEVAWQRHLMNVQTSSLRTVTNTRQLAESVAAFSAALDQKRPETKFAIAHVAKWIADDRSGAIAPSKWAGFRGMNPITYSALQELQKESGGQPRGFGGEKGRNAIKKLLGGDFVADPARTEDLRRRFSKVFGPASVKGVTFDTMTWMSLPDELPASPPPLARARNLVLYGPPGTGKTFATAHRAVALCDGSAPAGRTALMARYRALAAAGRIQFVTFHQSFSYEDFVEGIRPVLARSQGVPGGVRYELRDGIFKRLCRSAQAATQGQAAGPSEAASEAVPRAPAAGAAQAPQPLPHVLIIDEINRGNIAKILGELITLLEPDKRLGQANELLVRLPYSGELFGVPSNLHVVGTMNSADRSIALLDTALRRRFRFEEVRPDPAVICQHVGKDGVVQGVDVAALLETLNQRIELLLGRDHALGHAFFLGVTSLDDLAEVFVHAVLPLLREAFYENDGRICQVLGCPSEENGKQKNPHPMLVAELLDPAKLLGNSDDLDRRVRYRTHPELRRGGANLAERFRGIVT
jgi:5-methylcytosine-specific restriction protein B